MWRDLDRLVDDRLLNNDLEAHQLQLECAIDDNIRVLVLRENTFKDRRKDDDKFTSRNEWSLMSAKA
jgi:hypothetical protein